MVPDKIPDPFFHAAVFQHLTANNPGIPLYLKHQPVPMTVTLHQGLFPLLRIRIHAAEFIDPKLFPVPSHPFLGKENRPGGSNTDGRRQEECQHRSDQASRDSSGDVHGSLTELLQRGGCADAGGQHGIVPKLSHKLP